MTRPLEFKLRDLIPIFGAAKDILENKDIYLSKPDKIPVDKQKLIEPALIKLSAHVLYNVCVLKIAYTLFEKIN